MAYGIIDSQILKNIADAIRAKTGKTEMLFPNDMPAEIASISGGGGATTEPYVVYGRDESGAVTTAKLYNFTEISTSMFRDNTTLTTIDLSGSPNITSIGDYAFSGCTALPSFTIPKTVTSLGKYAFNGCKALTEIEIPSSVTTLGSYAFASSGLNKIVIPDHITTLGSGGTFNKCTDLYSVTIGSGLTSIPSETFQGCTKLVEIYNRSSITLTKGATANGYAAYYAINIYTPTSGESKLLENDNYVFVADENNNYTMVLIRDKTIANLTFPASVTIDGVVIDAYAIGYGIRNSNTALKSVVIPDAATSIGAYAFYNCKSLTTVTIGNGVTSIGQSGLSSCSKLATVTIGSGVSFIYSGALGSNSALTEVVFADTEGWYVSTSATATSGTTLTSANLSNASTAATYLKTTYKSYYWFNT